VEDIEIKIEQQNERSSVNSREIIIIYLYNRIVYLDWRCDFGCVNVGSSHIRGLGSINIRKEECINEIIKKSDRSDC
jgi:hypothetical protein